MSEERLNEALRGAEGLLDFLADIGQDDDLVVADALVAAARAYADLLANGERVWWCEEHGLPGGRDECWIWEFPGDSPIPPCRIVSRLLIRPTHRGGVR